MRTGLYLGVASAIVMAATGAAYLAVPGSALGIVGVRADPTSDFLLRTEGVAMLFGAAMLAVAQRGSPSRSLLAALGGYYLLGSAIDGIAFVQGVVGPASVPSVAVRVAMGVACLVAARGALEAER